MVTEDSANSGIRKLEKGRDQDSSSEKLHIHGGVRQVRKAHGSSPSTKEGKPLKSNFCGRLGESVVYYLANVLRTSFQNIYFFFDNFWTSGKQIRRFANMVFLATGTVRDSRTDNWKLKGDPCVVHWMTSDQRWGTLITLLPNRFGIAPTTKCKRYSAKEKSKDDISQPVVVHKYKIHIWAESINMTSYISNYRIGFQGENCYIPIVFWLLDLCATNGWLLVRECGYAEDNLSFRRKLSNFAFEVWKAKHNTRIKMNIHKKLPNY
nr:unnamed protein product [Callosobruchus analis]